MSLCVFRDREGWSTENEELVKEEDGPLPSRPFAYPLIMVSVAFHGTSFTLFDLYLSFRVPLVILLKSSFSRRGNLVSKASPCAFRG